MRFIRLRSNRLFSRVLAAACAGLSCAAANCSSDGDRLTFGDVDASSDAARSDGGGGDAESVGPVDGSIRDAGPFDASMPVVSCASGPCATALTVNASGDAQSFCALLHDGTVACWGANNDGQLGRGPDAGRADSAVAMRVVGLSNVIALDHTCAVDKDGAIYCWGKGPYLRSDAGAVTTEIAPVKLPIEHARKVSVGSATGCAVVDDGAGSGVVCWGSNEHQQVAAFDGANRYVSLPPNTVGLPSGTRPRDVVVGNAAFVVADDGVAVSWGETPPAGRVTSLLPDGLPQPIAISGVVTAVDVDIDNACAAASGTGYCWGAGVPSPRAVDLSRALPTPIVTPEPVIQVSTTRQRRVSVANSNTPLALPDRWCAVGISGDVYCWGYNSSGQAGDGTKIHAYDAVKVVGLPGPAAQVKASFDATCALLTTGKVYCWGGSFYGQLGTGELKVSSLTPQEVVLP